MRKPTKQFVQRAKAEERKHNKQPAHSQRWVHVNWPNYADAPSPPHTPRSSSGAGRQAGGWTADRENSQASPTRTLTQHGNAVSNMSTKITHAPHAQKRGELHPRRTSTLLLHPPPRLAERFVPCRRKALHTEDMHETTSQETFFMITPAERTRSLTLRVKASIKGIVDEDITNSVVNLSLEGMSVPTRKSI